MKRKMGKSKRRLAALAALVGSVAAAACGALGRPLEKPTVTVRGVALGRVSLSGLDGRLDFDLVNPNPVGVPLSALDWELAIGGARAVRGRAELSETIPARGTAPVAAAVHMGTVDAADVAARIAGGARGYRLSGTFHFATALGDLAVSFGQDGELGDL